MARNNEALKKYHFWILFGLVPLLVLIAVFTVTSSVGGAIDERVSKYKQAEKDIESKNDPKPKALIDELDKLQTKILARKGDLWKLNWEGDPARGFKGQKDLYTWPTSLKEIEQRNLKFGDKIPNDQDQYNEFKKPEVYLAEFSTAAPGVDKTKLAPGAKGMVEVIAPTQFRGGWQSILRHVNAFDDRLLTSEQIWLMMEDIWVQRSMLDAVRAVNAQMAAFERVKFEKDGVVIDDPSPKPSAEDPLRRKFKSRIWEVELEVVNKDNPTRKVLTGRLINHTDRLQLMGLGNTLTLKVWFEKDTDDRGRPRPDVRPFEFKIGGEFLPGRGAVKSDGKTPANVLEVVETPDHILPVTMTVDKIYKVEQVFDARTVPVRRIEAMELGKTDSRYAATPLQMPKFKVFESEAAAEAAATAAATQGEGMGGMGMSPIAIPGVSGRPGVGTPDGGPGDPALMGGTGTTRGGTVDAVVNANKKRYVQVTENVRRMPVAVALVIDQAYLQDALLAFANSPLRFQITQVNWARFRGQISGIGTGGGESPFPGGPGGEVISGRGAPASGILGRVDPDAGIRQGLPGAGGGFPGIIRPGLPNTGMGTVGPGPGQLPGESGSPYDPFGYGVPSSVSDSQLTSGLIELQVYGIVSLYEKYTPPGEAAPADAGAKEKEPKDKNGATPAEPKEKDKEPKEAVAPESRNPKMRRRNRA